MFIVPSLPSSFFPKKRSQSCLFSKQRRQLSRDCFARALDHQASSSRAPDLAPVFANKAWFAYPADLPASRHVWRSVSVGPGASAMDRRRTQICSKCKSNCAIFNHFTSKYGSNRLTGVRCDLRQIMCRR